MKKDLKSEAYGKTVTKDFFVNWIANYLGATSNRDFFNTLTTYDGQLKGGNMPLVATFKTWFDDHAWHDQSCCRVQ
jgi:hypothetical protein